MELLGISLVIAKNKQGKYLAVLENGDQGWWIPGGLVDPPETYAQAAVRETIEEAGINVVIKGILRIEQNIRNSARMKIVFYAEPIDENQIPKQQPDQESQCAKWVYLDQVKKLGKLRGTELLEFGQYIENGGIIYPLEILNEIQNKNINQENLTNNNFNLNHYQQKLQMLGLSLIIVKNKQGKFIAVKETKNRGWWIPGGKVDPPEDFQTAAIRECKEEAGLDIILKGVLRIEQNISNNYARIKVVFLAEPKDENQKPKHIADEESVEARWVTLQEFQQFNNLRGEELLEFGKYLQNGGIVYPLDILNYLKV